MNIKIALIIWIFVAMIASESDGKSERFRKGAMRWCNVFKTETVESGETVGDFCKQIRTEIKEFLTGIPSKITVVFLRIVKNYRQNTVKQTIEKVCQDRDFGDETIKGMMCARLLNDN